MIYSATDPTDAGKDNDDDGYTNLQEYNAGTDPNDPKDHPTEVAADGDATGAIVAIVIIIIIAGAVLVFFFLRQKKAQEERVEEALIL